MSIQSNKVLRDLVKCQCFEGNLICVNYDAALFVNFHNHDEKEISVRFRYDKNEMLSIIHHLVKNGFVEDISSGNRTLLIVTHDGNHQSQVVVSKVVNLLCCSVVLPLAVSLLTNIGFGILDRLFPNLFI